MTGSFRMRLWRRDALTRDLVVPGHLSGVRTPRLYDREPVIPYCLAGQRSLSGPGPLRRHSRPPQIFGSRCL